MGAKWKNPNGTNDNRRRSVAEGSAHATWPGSPKPCMQGRDNDGEDVCRGPWGTVLADRVNAQVVTRCVGSISPWGGVGVPLPTVSR